MNAKQLKQIISFSKPYYKTTGRWHSWDHILRVQKISIAIADKEFPGADKNILIAAATLHDIGRANKDDGHAMESGKIAKSFLSTIGLSKNEIQHLLDAFIYHEVDSIGRAKSLEARIVFDADKVDILSSYGFLRVVSWLIDERQMALSDAVNFLWEYYDKFYKNLYSQTAKDLIEKEMKLLDSFVTRFNEYDHKWNKLA